MNKAHEAGAFGFHADIMDGHFVPPVTFGAGIVKNLINAGGFRIDAHLMIEKPELQIEAFVEAGVKAITVHVESTNHLHRLLQMIRDAHVEAGIAFNPATPIKEILSNVLPLVDRVLVMTVNPGWGGQQLIPECLEKVKEVRDILDAHLSSAWLQVDGGITPDTARRLIELGANELVAGTAVFKGNITENIRKLQNSGNFV